MHILHEFVVILNTKVAPDDFESLAKDLIIQKFLSKSFEGKEMPHWYFRNEDNVLVVELLDILEYLGYLSAFPYIFTDLFSIWFLIVFPPAYEKGSFFLFELDIVADKLVVEIEKLELQRNGIVDWNDVEKNKMGGVE